MSIYPLGDIFKHQVQVREEVYRVQRLSNKLLSALRKQQKLEIPFNSVSAEARALAAETALLVKKYGVLEEQVIVFCFVLRWH